MALKFSKTPIGRFRLIAIAEGTSFLVLLLIAMPLKYMAHIPGPVKIIGWIHGLLFILYIVSVLQVKITYKWSFVKLLVAFIASLLPFGTFVLDSKLREEEVMITKQK